MLGERQEKKWCEEESGGLFGGWRGRGGSDLT